MVKLLNGKQTKIISILMIAACLTISLFSVKYITEAQAKTKPTEQAFYNKKGKLKYWIINRNGFKIKLKIVNRRIKIIKKNIDFDVLPRGTFAKIQAKKNPKQHFCLFLVLDKIKTVGC